MAYYFGTEVIKVFTLEIANLYLITDGAFGNFMINYTDFPNDSFISLK